MPKLLGITIEELTAFYRITIKIYIVKLIAI
jgi:hypothetical protein